jgi:hypothetical protein
MKRFAILAIMAAFLLATVGTASAEVVVKAKGQFRVGAEIIQNFGLNKGSAGIDDTDDFAINERARVDFRFVANENLEGIFYMEYGNANWGSPGVMAIGQSDAGTIEVRRAYVSFRWPDTDILFNIGLQNVALPAAYSGGYVLNEDVSAATVSTPITDMFAVTAGYVRAYDYASTRGSAGNDQPNADGHAAEEVDLGFIALPITPEGINFTPYFMYGYGGGNASAGAAGASLPSTLKKGLYGVNNTDAAGQGFNMYWAGAALTVDMFDPIVVMADFVWGQKTSSVENLRRDGWFMDFAVEYTGLDFLTPRLVFAYGSGEDDDPTNGSERLPALKNDDNYHLGTTFFGGSKFCNGDMGGGNNQLGYWAIALQIEDISFLEKLSHSFYFVYAQGTNDHKLLEDNWNSNLSTGTWGGITYGRTLFDKDNLYEVDFNTEYQIYEELSAVLELGWVYVSYDNDSWEKVNASYGGVEQAWKLCFGALYNF